MAYSNVVDVVEDGIGWWVWGRLMLGGGCGGGWYRMLVVGNVII